MSNAIYKPEVVIPTLRMMMREPNAPERIADLVIQIQRAAYTKGRSEVVSSVMNALFQTTKEDHAKHHQPAHG